MEVSRTVSRQVWGGQSVSPSYPVPRWAPGPRTSHGQGIPHLPAWERVPARSVSRWSVFPEGAGPSMGTGSGRGYVHQLLGQILRLLILLHYAGKSKHAFLRQPGTEAFPIQTLQESWTYELPGLLPRGPPGLLPATSQPAETGERSFVRWPAPGSGAQGLGMASGLQEAREIPVARGTTRSERVWPKLRAGVTPAHLTPPRGKRFAKALNACFHLNHAFKGAGRRKEIHNKEMKRTDKCRLCKGGCCTCF